MLVDSFDRLVVMQLRSKCIFRRHKPKRRWFAVFQVSASWAGDVLLVAMMLILMTEREVFITLGVRKILIIALGI